ncbi:unnamed protein product [Macrosiphum euphorbiae]|uniref:Uncharacterized protein n=1 Tax=Macrosiphum euphorbiae TaxID=13131 RepID=A0AAV0XEY5_9HEMI|nr:unnamed protein product [Macrosiphum euphorbiae]
MAVLKLIFIFIIGDFIRNVMLYDPMFTYTVRFKKVSVHPNELANFTINQYRGTQLFINGNLTLPPNIVTDKVIIFFHRCESDGINCKYFQTWIFTDICSKLKEKNQVWSRWYSSFDPPMVCPLDKVRYQIRNGTFDIGLVIASYPQVTYYQWRVIQKFYDNDTYLSSMILDALYFGYRKKIKNIPKP